MRRILPGTGFLLITATVFGQSIQPGMNPVIKLQNAPIYLERKIDVVPQTNEIVEGKFTRLIQFFQIPDQKTVQSLSNTGIQLVKYIPENAYYAVIGESADISNLNSPNTYSVQRIPVAMKLERKLAEGIVPHWAKIGSDKASVNLLYFTNFSTASVEASIRVLGGNIIGSDPNTGFLSLELPVGNIEKIAGLPFVFSVEPGEDQPQNDNLPGRTAHRSNVGNPGYPGTTKFDGSGVRILMGDDGTVGPHIDFTGRILQQFISSNGGNHGDHVAGTILGAGNINPNAMGMAPGADLYTHSFSSYISSMSTLYQNNLVRITSNSWNEGTGSCNTPYSALSTQVDQQTRTLPSLIYVFSSGNEGGSNCGYGAGAGWGNITGARKAAKNTLAVGNTTFDDVLNGGSSRGPAQDGRLKPEVVGVGTNVFSTDENNAYYSATGTSMSTPGISGTLAQLYQAYKFRNNGIEPNGGLMKAILMNSADDLGNPGPDFRFGYGRINAARALKYIDGSAYFTGTIAQGDSQTHTLNLPADAKFLKVLIYWVDMEAIPNASVVLVNNIDMEVRNPANQVFLPWVLNPAPTTLALNSNAVRSVESLNNHEQVTIDVPGGGAFEVKVKGTSIPMGPQTYYLVYEFGNEFVDLTYPNGGETFLPGASQTLRWDAYGTTYGFTQLQYSITNGATWASIGIPAAAARHYNWFVPASLEGKRVMVRVRRSLGASVFEDYIQEPISVMKTPDSLKIDWKCNDAFKLSWNPVPFSTGYIIYRLGTKYMDSVGFASTNSFVFSNIGSGADTWVTVRAVGLDGLRSERAIAIRKTTGAANCVQGFAAIDGSDSACTNNYVYFQDNSSGSAAGHQWNFGSGAIPATATGLGPFWVQYSTPGMKSITLKISTNGVADSTERVVSVSNGPNVDFNYSISSSVQNSVIFNSLSSNIDSVLWLLGDGNTGNLASFIHSYADTGVYLVRLIGYKSGCDPDTIQYPVELTILGLSNTFDLKDLKIYPNPGSGVFNVEFPANEIVNMTVMDMTGKVVQSCRAGNPERYALNLTESGKGVYILRVQLNDNAIFRKLVVE